MEVTTMRSTQDKVYQMTTAALLCAVGILIPLISPVKLVLEPASYTLASHVPIFMAMALSPATALFVAVGTTLGFFLSGFPLVVVLRAASHSLWAYFGARILVRKPWILEKFSRRLGFNLMLGLVHALLEMLVVMPFYFGQQMSAGYYSKGFLLSVVLLVGVGTVIHSMIDFTLARIIWEPLSKAAKLKNRAKSDHSAVQS